MVNGRLGILLRQNLNFHSFKYPYLITAIKLNESGGKGSEWYKKVVVGMPSWSFPKYAVCTYIFEIYKEWICIDKLIWYIVITSSRKYSLGRMMTIPTIYKQCKHYNTKIFAQESWKWYTFLHTKMVFFSSAKRLLLRVTNLFIIVYETCYIPKVLISSTLVLLKITAMTRHHIQRKSFLFS